MVFIALPGKICYTEHDFIQKEVFVLRKILALFLAALLLSGCAATPVETEPPETTVAQTTVPLTEPSTCAPQETTAPGPSWETLQTPESTCFTVISYCEATQELQVQFRESGAWYAYYDFEPEMWEDFKNAYSKGGFFNDYIKGNYEYKSLN